MSNMTKCSACGIEKHRKFLKDMPRGATGVREVYVDESNRQWIYKKCPDCKYAKTKALPVEKPIRKCRYCGEGLKVNYFYHNYCLTEMKDQVGYDIEDYVGG